MKYKSKLFLVRILIIIFLILSIVYVWRVFFDITGTGVVLKQTSPDEQYEVIVYRKKLPILFEHRVALNTIELYEKKSGKMICSFENENSARLARPTDIRLIWMEDGVFIKITGDDLMSDDWSYYILPYNE